MRPLCGITDGEEACDGNPLAETKALRDSGLDIFLHIIGFGTSQNVREQLEQIARVGGGVFYGAENEEELRGALGKASGTVAPRTRHLKISSPPGRTHSTKVLHKLQDGETIEIKLRPIKSVGRGSGVHAIKFQLGDKSLEFHETGNKWKIIKRGPSGKKTLKLPKNLKFPSNSWNYMKVVKDGQEVKFMLNQVNIGTLSRTKEGASFRVGVEGYEADISGLRVQLSLY